MITITCYKCRIEFGMPDDYYAVAKQAAESFNWYCPNGHQQHFASGETEAARMRRERDNALQRIAEWQDIANEADKQRKAAERTAAAARGQVTRIKKRAYQGVCPCCNRQFTNLQLHMHSKHPDFEKEPTA